ncbi:TetR/AcrR family transcriptional regulator [Marinicella sp. W31]|uniref:TetR/AcrR family transcriptional regulator n=1 Tax=Marinicella sp. W31 TaxID=3023713 RepID=UPI0037572770
MNDDFFNHKPKQKRAIESTQRILSAANKLFGLHGFNGTTISMIASEAQVSVGTLYHIFSDKMAIAKTIAKEYRKDAILEYQKVPTDIQKPEELKKVIRAFIKAAATLRINHSGYYAISRSRNPSIKNEITSNVRESIVTLFLEKLSSAFPKTENMQKTQIIFDMITETVRHFLDIIPPNHKNYNAMIQELESMVIAYADARLFD